MPGVAAGAAVTPCHRSVARDHLLDADLMVRAAIGEEVCDTALFTCVRDKLLSDSSVGIWYFQVSSVESQKFVVAPRAPRDASAAECKRTSETRH